MYLVDPNDHILKVSYNCLYFWQSYSGSLIKLLTCRRREGRRGTHDYSGCLAIATVGQRATVGQGLPNMRWDEIRSDTTDV